tara:strand:+ start:34060 stop:34398 length:339 start_codon:yes stop_codon:yes gene_type:complete
MAVPALNIVIEQGTDFERIYAMTKSDGSVLDLTPYTFTAKMRKHFTSAGSVSFAATYGATPGDGNLTISLTDTQTGILTTGRYDYDIVIENLNNGTKTKVITGQVKVNGTVS